MNKLNNFYPIQNTYYPSIRSLLSILFSGNLKHLNRKKQIFQLTEMSKVIVLIA